MSDWRPGRRSLNLRRRLGAISSVGRSAGSPARKPRRRSHAHAARPGAGWVPTAERFRDPASRVVMRVWIDPADQSRHYVPEPDA